MLIGITATNCWNLAEFHAFMNWGQKQATIGIQFSAGILGKQLIDLSSKIAKKHKFAPSVSSSSQLFFSFNYSSYREHQSFINNRPV